MADRGEWILARTKPAREQLAARNIRRQNHEYYLAQFFDKRRCLRRSLFPSYIFVLIFDREYGFLNNTFGISRVMSCGDDPAVVNPAVIEELRSRENKNGIIQLPEQAQDEVMANLKPGDSVRVTEGPFVGFNALYQGMSSHSRVKILLSLLSGAKFSASIEREILQPAYATVLQAA